MRLHEKMGTRHETALADWAEALAIVARHYGTTALQLRRDFSIRLLNTALGSREFSRLLRKGEVYDEPVLAGCEYGHVLMPKHTGGTYFIQVRGELWDSGVDLVPTFIHELLHIINSKYSEDQVAKMEKQICDTEGIERDDLLGPISGE